MGQHTKKWEKEILNIYLFFVLFITIWMNILERWSILYGKQKAKINKKGITLSKMATLSISTQKQPEKGDIEGKQAKLNEVINISNYLSFQTQQAQVNLLKKLIQLFHIQSQFIIHKLTSITQHLNFIKTQQALDTSPQKSKIQICFSSKWRQTQQIIFLLVKKYITCCNKQKIRLILLNKRGFIMQTISNLDPSKYQLFIAKAIKKSYSKLTRLIIIPFAPQIIDLDFYTTLQQNLKQVKIMAVSCLTLKDIYNFKQKTSLLAQFYQLKLQDEWRYGIILQQNVLLYSKFHMQIQHEDYHWIVSKSIEIIKREDKVNQYFNYIPQYNSTQFFIRLFTFYYNFVAIKALQLEHQNRINLEIITKLILQLQSKISKENNKSIELPSASNGQLQFIKINKQAQIVNQISKADVKECNQTKSPSENLKNIKQRQMRYGVKCYQQLKQGWNNLLQDQKINFQGYVQLNFCKWFDKDLNQGISLLQFQHDLMMKPKIKMEQFQVKKQEYL